MRLCFFRRHQQRVYSRHCIRFSSRHNHGNLSTFFYSKPTRPSYREIMANNGRRFALMLLKKRLKWKSRCSSNRVAPYTVAVGILVWNRIRWYPIIGEISIGLVDKSIKWTRKRSVQSYVLGIKNRRTCKRIQKETENKNYKLYNIKTHTDSITFFQRKYNLTYNII